ncbi:ABC transporter permease [Oleiagrimonas soli]|uniref:Transport permease protein n=1 Tax=Oleiagrimonas soli TaxID=1543381 RepID=A0A099CY49_9GAMM|nr:ABC transporter permease [Oleiagrimonas soli]KGI78699.1 ABC transporter permease [Oleiagrimonas soli]MBB6183974.1 ABC-2 type transport system permease protein [Oleiagrimonas soli]
MQTVTTSMTAPADGGMPMPRVFGAYLAEIRSECLRYLRNPGFMLPLTLFPTVFYLMFGVLMNHGHPDAARYLLASYSTFGVMGPGLFGFGVSLALERDGGLLTLKRALPMPSGAYLLGKMVMAMVAAGVVVTLMLLLSVFAAHVPLSAAQMLALLAMGVLGVLPFCALGMFVGTLIKGQGAPGLLNLVYLPMSFLSGLWFPLSAMPHWLGAIAPVWPSYHLNAIAQRAVGLSHQPVGTHALVLLGVAAGLLMLAARRLRRYG